MSVLLDYLDWRGDLSFQVDPVNEADYYLISKIGCPDLTGLVPSDAQEVPLPEVGVSFRAQTGNQDVSLGVSQSPQVIVILGAALQATDLAQYLIAQGKNVQLVQEKGAEFVADGQSPWVKTYVRAHLYAHGVKVWNNATVESVADDAVTITLNGCA